jgi:WD40 repeat protein
LAQTGFKIHDIKTGALLGSVETPTPNGSGPRAYCATVSPDGKLLAVASGNMGTDGVISLTLPGVLRIWDIAKQALLFDLPDSYLTVHTSFSPDGKWVTATSTGPRGEKSRVSVYDVEKGSLLRKIERELPDTFNSATFTQDGQWLAIPGEKTILLWKMHP